MQITSVKNFSGLSYALLILYHFSIIDECFNLWLQKYINSDWLRNFLWRKLYEYGCSSGLHNKTSTIFVVIEWLASSCILPFSCFICKGYIGRHSVSKLKWASQLVKNLILNIQYQHGNGTTVCLRFYLRNQENGFLEIDRLDSTIILSDSTKLFEVLMNLSFYWSTNVDISWEKINWAYFGISAENCPNTSFSSRSVLLTVILYYIFCAWEV